MKDDAAIVIRSNRAALTILDRYHPDFVALLRDFMGKNTKDPDERQILGDMIIGAVRHFVTEGVGVQERT